MTNQGLIEQKISLKQSVVAGGSHVFEIEIPDGRKAFLKGYGSSWSSGIEVKLTTGLQPFPRRKDQEGSISQPVIYGEPFPIGSGKKVQLEVFNTTGFDINIQVVFLLLVNSILDIESDGDDILFNVGVPDRGYLIGDEILTEVNSSGASPTFPRGSFVKVASITLLSNLKITDTVLRLKTSLKRDNSNFGAEGKYIRIRGEVETVIGSLMVAASSSYAEFSQDITGFETGDIIELQYKREGTIDIPTASAWRGFKFTGLLSDNPSNVYMTGNQVEF